MRKFTIIFYFLIWNSCLESDLKEKHNFRLAQINLFNEAEKKARNDDIETTSVIFDECLYENKKINEIFLNRFMGEYIVDWERVLSFLQNLDKSKDPYLSFSRKLREVNDSITVKKKGSKTEIIISKSDYTTSLVEDSDIETILIEIFEKSKGVFILANDTSINNSIYIELNRKNLLIEEDPSYLNNLSDSDFIIHWLNRKILNILKEFSITYFISILNKALETSTGDENRFQELLIGSIAPFYTTEVVKEIQKTDITSDINKQLRSKIINFIAFLGILEVNIRENPSTIFNPDNEYFNEVYNIYLDNHQKEFSQEAIENLKIYSSIKTIFKAACKEIKFSKDTKKRLYIIDILKKILSILENEILPKIVEANKEAEIAKKSQKKAKKEKEKKKLSPIRENFRKKLEIIIDSYKEAKILNKQISTKVGEQKAIEAIESANRALSSLKLSNVSETEQILIQASTEISKHLETVKKQVAFAEKEKEAKKQALEDKKTNLSKVLQEVRNILPTSMVNQVPKYQSIKGKIQHIQKSIDELNEPNEGNDIKRKIESIKGEAQRLETEKGLAKVKKTRSHGNKKQALSSSKTAIDKNKVVVERISLANQIAQTYLNKVVIAQKKQKGEDEEERKKTRDRILGRSAGYLTSDGCFKSDRVWEAEDAIRNPKIPLQKGGGYFKTARVWETEDTIRNPKSPPYLELSAPKTITIRKP